MTDTTRAAVAFLVGTLVNEQKRGGVFDHGKGRFIAMSLALTPPQVLIHSAEEGVHLQAQITPTGIRLQDFSTNRHLRLEIDEKSFTGYDEHTASEFGGVVHGILIYLFDEDGKRGWNYSH
jgi:hypothetical protein